MKKVLKTLLKVFKWIGIVILGLIIVLLLIRFVGKLCYNRTPDGGINETMYADINGTKQWISIYGQDRDNPVLLYIADRTQYQVPFYLIQGENDHNVGTMVEVAAAYYEKVEAPDKDICMINGGHVSPLLCCDQLAAFVHKIAEKNHS